MKLTWMRCVAARNRGLVLAAALLVSLSASGVTPPATPWTQPAAALSARIAELLGPGEARLTLRNLSSIPADQLPAIRRLLEQDLNARGVTMGGAESANAVHITLSENAQERLWVAEVAEGSDTRVAIVALPSAPQPASKPAGALVLREQWLLSSREPILALLETNSQLLALQPDRIVSYARTAGVWQEQQHVTLAPPHPLGRDAHGTLLAESDGAAYSAWLPGTQCSGTIASPGTAELSIHCHESDDPWPLAQPQPATQPQLPAQPQLQTQPQPQTSGSAPPSPIAVRAFYNPARNYFTGVLVPNPGTDLPPFYSLALLPRPAGSAALLIGGISGKVQMAQDGALAPVAGTRDWGSDFAVLQSGCGSGTQVIVSGSGDALGDSLRAYQLPGNEAVPVSEPLPISGTVMALIPAQEQTSLLAIVRTAGGEYEVDRVTALCN